MRIVIANRTGNATGGVEEYIQHISSALTSRGHQLAFCFEHRSLTAPLLSLPGGAPIWSVDELGLERVMRQIRTWAPNTIYCNGLDSPALERRLTALAPAAYSAHGYFGTCISGHKMHSFPRRVPCERAFGAACLAQFFPRRCGGLNPITMLNRYKIEADRLKAIRSYSVVIAHSEHMRAEYKRHGIDAALVPLTLPTDSGHVTRVTKTTLLRLLFLGRMNDMKGGDLLIDAAEKVARSGDRQVELVMAGEGQARSQWTRQAGRASRRTPKLAVRFSGWVDAEARRTAFSQTDILVVPSCWPEPFGMVGLEAAAFGIPAVAFDVGGISDWLEDGVNGCFARGRIPSASSLAVAIGRCAEPASHEVFAAGARAGYQRRLTTECEDKLIEVFRRLTGGTV